MVGFSLPLTFPLLTLLLYHRIAQKSIRNIAQSFGEKIVQNDGRQFVGKKCHLWKILEKRRIDDIIVVDSENIVQGCIDVQDLPALKIM